MARKNTSGFITRVKGAEQLKKRVSELRESGYVAIMPTYKTAVDLSPQQKTWDECISAQVHGSSFFENGSAKVSPSPTLYFASGNEVFYDVVDKGTEGKGYIEWGWNNMLPNLVGLLTQMLPYTAAGIKFNTDICAGLGPQPMYDVTQYIGGNITTKFIRYKDAGRYLQGRIVDKQRELLNIQSEYEKDGDNDLSWTDGYIQKGANPKKEAYESLVSAMQKEIDSLEMAYKDWEKTNTEVQDFLDRNNIAQLWLSLATDEQMFGICFPELQLNQQSLDKNGKPVETYMWKPKVTGIGYHSCHTTRLERMDDNGRINYVYCSARWLDKPFVEQGGDLNAPTIAVPCLDPLSPLASLEAAVREARQRNVSVKNRPTHFVLPSYYPTAGRPYYPVPAWHSIFGGDIYEYLSTIISDRFNRKKNSSVIGRIIYLHNDYMQQLFIQQNAQSDSAKQAKVRDELYNQINTWLSNRNNAGQSLLAFTFMGNDGKEHKSFEIVEIEASNANTATANEKETAEISSIVFMALGLDARLLGSSPLSLVGNSSGTDIRERLLMRQILMSPTQSVMLKCLEVASRFNGWDKHLVWKIQREVMTTLDRSKTGVSLDTDNNQ